MILESRHRYLILAGTFFLVGCLGSIVMLVHNVDLSLARGWFYLFLTASLYSLTRGFLEWKAEVEAELGPGGSDGAEPHREIASQAASARESAAGEPRDKTRE
jgi:hypothetical protein